MRGDVDVDAVAAGLRAHLAAGGDQIAIRVLSPDGGIPPDACALTRKV